MAVSNFTYDGIPLTGFNRGEYILAFFDSETTPEEGKPELQRISQHMGMYQPFVYQTHPDTLTFTMGIIKNPCVTDQYEISAVEMEQLKRWLCRPTACKLKVSEKKSFQEDWESVINQYDNVFWEGTFTIVEEIQGGKRIGLTLNFISTRPYGLQEDVTYTGTVNSEDSIQINDTSAEIGYIYPQMVIKCLEAGDLIIYNEINQRATIVENCAQNETLIFSKDLQLTTDDTSHTIYNNFNYKFLRIENTFDDNINNISFSLNCEYEITYNPVRKIMPI